MSQENRNGKKDKENMKRVKFRENIARNINLSSVLTKKVGDFNKKESESLEFTGLEIPRDYLIY